MPLTIDIVSDVVCPWCFIGKRHLETALAQYQADGTEAPRVRWLPFQLNPDLPGEGVPRKTYLERKFGGPEHAQQIYARVTEAGRQAALALDFDRIEVQPNTLQAHRLIHVAGQLGRQDAMVEALFRAYFFEGADLTRDDRLAAIAAGAGFSEDTVRAYLAGDEDRAETAHLDWQARQRGISGVPFFIFNDKYAASGAQPPAVLLQAMRKASADADR